MFAKLFEHKEAGQVLVKKDENDEGFMEIRFFIEPKDLGVCSVAISFTNIETADEACEEVFEGLDKEMVNGIIDGLLEEVNKYK